jgi:hypothetical protein
MINLNTLLRYKEIESLGYDSVYTEYPVPNIIKMNWKTILSPPPSNNSKTTLLELKKISKTTLNRTSEDINIIHLVDQDPDQLFENLVKSYNLQYPISKITAFYNVLEPVLLNVKAFWNRPRPLQLAKYFNIPIDVILTDSHHTASYPSGHTMYGEMVSLIIQDTYPHIDKQELSKLVDMIAKARIMQGVHYPSDNIAALKLSKILFNSLIEVLDFRNN